MVRRTAGVGVADPAEIGAYPPRLRRDVVALACRAAQRRAGDRRVHVDLLDAAGTVARSRESGDANQGAVREHDRKSVTFAFDPCSRDDVQAYSPAS